MSSRLANAIRILSMDGIQKANSGHPGAPMGMADMATVLWKNNLNHNPKNPKWFNRDRFVLSNGHASMLIYSLLHLTGYDVSIDDLKSFRQLDSKTAGHPELGMVPGVETTTGPLGQGLSNGVGMALAEKNLANKYNKDGHEVIDHYTYVFAGDGCLMEGLSHEVASLAGTWELGKLILFYDSNGISIDGEIDGWFTDDTKKRFESYNWQVLEADGHDHNALQTAIDSAKKDENRPTIIICTTEIGFGSPNKGGKEESHGAPLGDDEIELTREKLGWESQERFFVPEDIYSEWDCSDKGQKSEDEWNSLFNKYSEAYPEDAAELSRRISGELPAGWEAKMDEFIAVSQKEGADIASRKSSQLSINILGELFPELIGGAADLAPSNLTFGTHSVSMTKDNPSGNYLHYGVREFGMSGIMNGLTLHGGFIPYGGTFLIFMEYAKNALRMAALMKLKNIYVFTHDSIGVGEDGPTHQPIEQPVALRTTPGMVTWRPADVVETAVGWKEAIKRNGPTSLLLSRQNLPKLDRNVNQVSNISKGAYIIKDSDGKPDVIIIATGSEVALACESAEASDKKVRVVSMPSPEVFEQQTSDYKESILPSSIRNRIAIEASHSDFWYKYVGLDGQIIAMTGYGESGPGAKLFERFGFTVEKVVNSINKF